MIVLKAENISKKYSGRTIIQDINIELKQGELVCLLGVSGSGKTTLFHVLSGLTTPDTGRVLLKGEDVTSHPGQVSYMLQKDLLFAHKKIIDNVSLPLILKGMKKEDAQNKANPLFEQFGLEGTQYQYPCQLSGGMRQRVMIAIALACEPKLLIADEPTTALDVTIQAQILELMMELKEKLGMAIIMITHDLGIVAATCEKIAVMYAGHIVEYGTTDDIFYRPKHEYTKGLIRSIPRMDAKDHEKLIPIEGTPVDMLNPPKGCPFASRCDSCMKICLRQMPPVTHFDDVHYTQCWLNQKAEFEAQNKK